MSFANESPPETSIRYDGWRVVAVCFIAAIFAWGLGFYGQGLYLAELHRSKGWSTSLMSTATTLYYLSGSGLVIFISDILRRFGPRAVMIFGAFCFASALTILAFVTAPWQVFVAYFVMATGWMTMSLGSITNTVGLWFMQKRGLAISIALTGASFGGIVLTPAMVAATTRWGFVPTMLGTAVVTLAVIVPLALFCIGKPPAAIQQGATKAAGQGAWTRRRALRSLQFWTMSLPFALAIGAQVGFLVHQIALLEPRIGLQLVGVAVAVTTTMAVLGRLAMGVVVDRLNLRLVSAGFFLSQAAAIALLLATDSHAAIFLACALFGFSVGNLITLPSLIISREFDAASFGMLVGLSVAINQVIYAFGPGVVGWLRDFTGSYSASLMLCIGLETVAAAIILVPFRDKGEGDATAGDASS